MDFKDPRNPMWPHKFEFIPFDSGRVMYQIPPNETRRIAHYSLTMDYTVIHHNWFYLDEDVVHNSNNLSDKEVGGHYPKDVDIQLRSVLRPQWPWILAQCFLMGDINPYISNIRLLALLYTLDNFGVPVPEGYLREFSVPKFTDKFTLEQPTLVDWLRLMYPVVASFGSRFHNPSSMLKDTYGHLLSKCRPHDKKSDMLK